MVGRAARQSIEAERLVAASQRDRADEASARVVHLEAVLDALAVGVVVRSSNGDVVFRNRLARSLLVARGNDVLIEGVIEDFASSSPAGERRRILELIGPPSRTVEVSEVPINDGGGVIVVDDVTEIHRTERIRRDFVANVSHELKTPLGAISLLAETLEDVDDLDVRQRLLTQLQAEAERASLLVDDLLDLSYIEAAGSLEAVPVDIVATAALAISWCGAATHKNDVTVVEEFPQSALIVSGDERLIATAIRNLLSNAIAYSDRGATVVIAVRATADGYVEIEVRDRGCGIPARDLDRIFERFYRVDRARSRETGGTGLGLSITRHIVDNHGGSVAVWSEEGVGSVFTIRLPLADNRQTQGETQ